MTAKKSKPGDKLIAYRMKTHEASESKKIEKTEPKHNERAEVIRPVGKGKVNPFAPKKKKNIVAI